MHRNMALLTKRRVLTVAGALALLFVIFNVSVDDSRPAAFELPAVNLNDGKFHWQNVHRHYPVDSLIPLPTGRSKRIPKIQHAPPVLDKATETVRLQRLAAVKTTFLHSWHGYKDHAWMADEVGPLSGTSHNFFGGWAASLVDALDTLWIMGLKDEFEHAVKAIEQIDFTTTEETTLNVFETTIRYMGGFLSAYDLSGGKYPSLLTKAMELGEMLLVAFDTPNHMPVTRWQWREARAGKKQEASNGALLAEIGSMTLEFTRLSQLTGDGRYFDAVQRISDEFEKQQMSTRLPGMWPVIVNARDLDFGQDTGYTLGAMADSTYEYLPKQYMLLGGKMDQYQRLYERAADVFEKHHFFRPMTKDNADILFSGFVRSEGGNSEPILEPSLQHLVCFTGGMVGIAAKIFDNPKHLSVARKLADGCMWAYDSIPSKLMAEVSHHVACDSTTHCEWNETSWHEGILARKPDAGSEISYDDLVRNRIASEHLPPGYTSIDDHRYILRPEAIESLFIMYRITGDVEYQNKAWRMFEAIDKHTKTNIANAALDDILQNPPSKADRMESFWMAETLKYFYLIFSDFEHVSLDDFVFNTEAHPFSRPK